jgi:hypothetical protein
MPNPLNTPLVAGWERIETVVEACTTLHGNRFENCVRRVQSCYDQRSKEAGPTENVGISALKDCAYIYGPRSLRQPNVDPHQ